MRQSDRFDLYREAIDRLQDAGLVYECYCTRREIREAAQAPQGADPDGSYPGTCRTLDRTRSRAHAARRGRRPALRLLQRRSRRDRSTIDSVAHTSGRVDDVVLQRNDGVPAYNLAVVVDDAAQDVTQVVRGDDLIATTPRQIVLHRLLEPAGSAIRARAAGAGTGRHTIGQASWRGHIGRSRRATAGHPADVCARLAASLGIDTGGRPVMAGDLLDRFDPDRMPSTPWLLTRRTNSDTISPMFDDLQQLFGYHGAIDERIGCRRGRPGSVRRAVLDAAVLRHRRARRRGASARSSRSPTIRCPVTRSRWPSSAPACSKPCRTISARESGRSCRRSGRTSITTGSAMRSSSVTPHGEQESLRIHHDVAQVSGSIKLNEGYTGADLVFPRQVFDNSAVAVGSMLVWPSLVTHPHETCAARAAESSTH